MQRQARAWGSESDKHGHTHLPPGNLTDAEMRNLRVVKTAEFDHFWAQMMTFHEYAATELADVELQQGVHPPTRALARSFQAEEDRPANRLLALLESPPR
jgi:uncharacterized protein (DUF305 family)